MEKNFNKKPGPKEIRELKIKGLKTFIRPYYEATHNKNKSIDVVKIGKERILRNVLT